MSKKKWTDEKKAEATKEIFRLMSEEGLSIRKITSHFDMPNRDTFNTWIREDKELSDQYARAREMRSDLIFDEILEIADSANADAYVDDNGVVKIDGEAIQRSRLKIDARKWTLSKMQPKKYGDKSTLELEGSKDKPINIISLGQGQKPD